MCTMYYHYVYGSVMRTHARTHMPPRTHARKKAGQSGQTYVTLIFHAQKPAQTTAQFPSRFPGQTPKNWADAFFAAFFHHIPFAGFIVNTIFSVITLYVTLYIEHEYRIQKTSPFTQGLFRPPACRTSRLFTINHIRLLRSRRCTETCLHTRMQ